MIWKNTSRRGGPSDLELKKYSSSGDIVMVKHDIPNRPFMIVQSIDKLVASGDRVALLGVTCIWFSLI
jgi:hypothetical protein